ncbi:hypothetical protein DEH69_05440 [Streptomyces sp. PT12]|nr:hypothetical protein DEH69_05440 [Streptomyces sp. PT12]
MVVGSLRRGEGGAQRWVTALAEAWVRGVGVDWSPLLPAAGSRAARELATELPTYPFQHRRYWLESTPAESGGRPADADELRFWEAVEAEDLQSLGSLLEVSDDQSLQAVLPAVSQWRRRTRERSTVGSWLYRAAWERLTGAVAAREAGSWLVVLPPKANGPSGLADATAVAEALARAGAEVHRVTVDAAAQDRAAIAATLQGAFAEHPDADGVLSLLALDERPHRDHFGLTVGVAGTLLLTQALVDIAPDDARLWAATSGAVGVSETDPSDHPAQAQLWGIGQVAAVEHPQLWGGLLDIGIPPGEHATDLGWLDEPLLAALTGDADEDQFALRPDGTFVRRLTRLPAPTREPAEPWTPRDTVLITGGAGTMAEHLARWAARGGARRVVLLDQDATDETADTPLAAELAELDVTVTLVPCDPTDRAQLAGLIKRLTDEGDTIRAVLHTAATVELAALTETTLPELTRALLAKVGVAQHLDELLDRDALDAVVHFTSVAGVWGSGNHTGYAAANAHLDALARQRRASGAPDISVAWALWEMSESEISATPNATDAIRQARAGGLPPLPPELALAALGQVLSRGLPFAAVAAVDWGRFAPTFTLARPSRLIEGVLEARAALTAAQEEESTDGRESEELRARLAALPVEEQQAELTRLVCGYAGSVLGHAPDENLEPQRAFKDLGIESMTAIDLRNRLNRATGLKLPATLVFEYPTPAALAEHLRAEIVRDGTMSVATLHAELDRMDRGLSQATASEAERAQIAQRLERMLAAWTGAEAKSDTGEDFADKLESASDDEVFEFLHRELGKPS